MNKEPVIEGISYCSSSRPSWFAELGTESHAASALQEATCLTQTQNLPPPWCPGTTREETSSPESGFTSLHPAVLLLDDSEARVV